MLLQPHCLPAVLPLSQCLCIGCPGLEHTSLISYQCLFHYHLLRKAFPDWLYLKYNSPILSIPPFCFIFLLITYHHLLLDNTFHMILLYVPPSAYINAWHSGGAQEIFPKWMKTALLLGTDYYMQLYIRTTHICSINVTFILSLSFFKA